MIRATLKKYFNLLYETNLHGEELSKEILGDISLEKEILKRKEFKQEWHKTLGYTYQNEKYRIISIKIIKESSIIKAFVSVLHSFMLNNTPSKTISAEKLNYIFILRKINRKFKIVECCCKEEFPDNYNSILHDDESYSKARDSGLYIENNSRYKFWESNYKNIASLIKFAEDIQIKYRTSYEDESLETRLNYESEYNPFEAVKYAKQYALNYNKDFRSFNDLGGDCTNYVSQCLHFGGLRYTNLWKPYTNSWIRVSELYNLLTKKGYGKSIAVSQLLTLGSIIQFYSSKKGYYSHSGIITEVLANGDYLYCCHSYDKLDFPLSEIYPLFYDKFRVVEIYK